jgi:hypothetical protein
MTLPDKYWETHWEVRAWNTSVDEPYVNFFPTKEEALAEVKSLTDEGYADVEVIHPTKNWR